MSNLTATAQWIPVRKLLRTHDVDAGENGDGPSNWQAQDLLDRTEHLKGMVDGAIGDLADEVSARVAVDAVLASDISDEASARASADAGLASDIATEASARAAADTTLNTAITTEATNRATAISTAIATEVTNRDAAIAAAIAGIQVGVDPSENGFRLSLVSGDPAGESSGASNLRLTPYKGATIALWDGSTWVRRNSAEVTLALSGMTTNTLYDVFAYWTGSAVALERVAWSSSTARATALARQDGVYCKSGDLTRRYVGTFRATSATQTVDEVTRRFLWNYSNRVRRHLAKGVNNSVWTWVNPGADWRQANATSSNAVEVVIGVQEVLLEVHVQCPISVGGGVQAWGGVGVGIDSTTVNSAQVFGVTVDSVERLAVARYADRPAIGYHKVNWLDGASSGSATWTYGSSGGASTRMTVGMVGEIEC